MKQKRTSTRGGTVGKATRYAETPLLEVLYTEHERQARRRSQQVGPYSTSFQVSMTSVGPLGRHVSFSSPQVPTPAVWAPMQRLRRRSHKWDLRVVAPSATYARFNFVFPVRASRYSADTVPYNGQPRNISPMLTLPR